MLESLLLWWWSLISAWFFITSIYTIETDHDFLCAKIRSMFVDTKQVFPFQTQITVANFHILWHFAAISFQSSTLFLNNVLRFDLTLQIDIHHNFKNSFKSQDYRTAAHTRAQKGKRTAARMRTQENTRSAACSAMHTHTRMQAHAAAQWHARARMKASGQQHVHKHMHAHSDTHAHTRCKMTSAQQHAPAHRVQRTAVHTCT
jgi:hypothetical protein